MNYEILEKEPRIEAYDPFIAQLRELQTANAKAVFNYEDPKGNKAARSHIYKLRQTKSALETVRKKEKETSLAYGRMVDAKAKEIANAIDNMISVHESPLKEIEEREGKRIAELKNKIVFFQDFTKHSSFDSSDNFKLYIQQCEQEIVDGSYQEFIQEAIKQKESALSFLRNALAKAEKREEEQEELERLRKEAQEREKKDREERIAREAAEQARIAAEARAAKEKAEEALKAKRVEEAAERREMELKLLAERAEAQKLQAIRDKEDADRRAEQARIEAVQQAERAAQHAREQAAREQAEQEKMEAEEKAKREANKRHKAKINGAALQSLVDNGISQDVGKQVITLIAQGRIPAVKIEY